MNNLRFSVIKRNFVCCFSSKVCYPLCNVALLGDKFGFLSLHTSSEQFKFAEPKPRPTVYKQPVDWLPFPWHRRRRFNLFTDSGDLIKENPVDPTLPKPDFELSDELKSADEAVRNIFTLATASKNEARETYTRNVLKRIQRHPFDFDSLEVRIALKTIQVRALFEHYRTSSKKELYVRRFVTPILIQKRNKLLKSLRNIDEDRFNWLCQELQLYYNPKPLQLQDAKYCKKWDLRQMTKEYCDKLIADKKAAYHAELKAQQEEFLEEKNKILSWIEEEEKALKLL